MTQPAPAATTLQPSAAADAPWQLCLLGRVQATGLWGEVYRWPLRSVAVLLARLALAPGRQFGREELVDTLWPGASLDRGKARLRQTLSELRALLEPAGVAAGSVIVANRLTIHLNPSALACDVQRFERLAASGDRMAAQGLYRGEFMPGYFDEWVQEERQRLQALFDRLGAAHGTAADAVATPPLSLPLSLPSAPPDAAHGLPEPSSSPPATETAPRAAGLAALPVYWTRAFGQATRIQQLQQLLLEQRLVTVLAPGGQGKTRLAVATLRSWVEGPHPPPAPPQPQPQPLPQALTAPPADLLRFVPLSACTTEDALWVALAEALGIKGAGAHAQGVQRQLLLRPALLLLDNVEQLDNGAVEALAGLLQAVPDLRLLLTSRRVLGLDGEAVFALRGLDMPTPVSNDDEAACHAAPAREDGPAEARTRVAMARTTPAIALFADRASQARADFRLNEVNLPDVLGLVQYLHGMPLAIELAASRMRVLQPRELLQRLQSEAGSPHLDLLARSGADVQPSPRTRHGSMRQVVAWSWRQLPQDVAQMLCALTVFSLPASAEAAAQALAGLRRAGQLAGEAGAEPLSAFDDAPVSAAQALLGEAVDWSLLQAIAPNSSPDASPDQSANSHSRYALLQPVREFAAELMTTEQAVAVRSRLRRWLCAMATHRLRENWEALRQDLQHITPLILHAQADAAPREALALATALRTEWYHRALPPVLLAALESALVEVTAQQGSGSDRTSTRTAGWSEDAGTAAPGVQSALLSRSHSLLATMYQTAGELTQAERHGQAAEHTASDDLTLAMALAIRANLLINQTNSSDAAEGWLARGLVHARRSGDARAQVQVLRQQAVAAINIHQDYARAEPLAMECLQLQKTLGDPLQVCYRQCDLAACWLYTGRAEAAAALVESALIECRRHEPSVAQAYAMCQLGRIRLALRQPLPAARVLHEAAFLGRQHDWNNLLLTALCHLPDAWARMALGQPGEPADLAERAARLQGYAEQARTQLFGPINAIERREMKRARRLLCQRLGVPTVMALRLAGSQLSPQQAMALLGPLPAA